MIRRGETQGMQSEGGVPMEFIDFERLLLVSVRSPVPARMILESLSSEPPVASASVKTWEQLREVLRQHPSPVMHIVGRSLDGESVELDDAGGEVRAADRDMLAGCREELMPVSVVILDGCYGEVPARAWLSHVDVVIGIPAAVSPTASARFASEFYAALANERAGQVIEAYDHAFGVVSDHRIELLLRRSRFMGTREHTHPGATHSSMMLAEGMEVSTLGELLDAIRDGVAVAQPVLVEARGTPRTMAGGAPTFVHGDAGDVPVWMEEYARAYALNWVVPIGAADGDGAVTIGRAPQCDICIDDGSVSRVHASFILERGGGRHHVMDEHSRNGTCINGDPIPPGVPTSISSGAYVSFGDALFLFFGPVALRTLARIST